MRNGSRIQQECSSCLKELSDFCADVKIYCGEYAKHFSNLSEEEQTKLNKKLDLFISNHNLEIVNQTNVKAFMHYYIYILNIICTYFKKKFEILNEAQEIYRYDFEIEEGIAFEVIVYEVKIKHTSNGEEFYYYYYNYKFTKSKFEENYILGKPDKSYNCPIFIIPTSSKVNSLGMYDCYIKGCNYFCKPIEYRFQCTSESCTKYNEQHENTIQKRQLNDSNKYYLFIGDLISKHTFGVKTQN